MFEVWYEKNIATLRNAKWQGNWCSYWIYVHNISSYTYFFIESQNSNAKTIGTTRFETDVAIAFTSMLFLLIKLHVRDSNLSASKGCPSTPCIVNFFNNLIIAQKKEAVNRQPLKPLCAMQSGSNYLIRAIPSIDFDFLEIRLVSTRLFLLPSTT